MPNTLLNLREPFSGVTHIIAALLAIVGLILLICKSAMTATAWHIVSFSIYGVSLVTLFVMSALYHSLRVSERAEDVLLRLDHAMIYFLIAGSYTPICLVVLRGGWGWSLFGVNWALAIAGIVLKIVFKNPSRSITAVFFAFFIIMGWLAALAWAPLARALPERGFLWLLAGGLFYTVGALLLNIKCLNIRPGFGAHEIWHLFVIAGSFSHYWVMYRYIMYLK